MSDQAFVIIDDEREVCDLLRLLFESRGRRCLVAHDGRQGLELVRDHQPAAVFLDVAMPVMNGYEVLNILKSDQATKHIPVLVMTALTRNSDLSRDEWARSIGADAFLNKPFEIDDLLASVEGLTGLNI